LKHGKLMMINLDIIYLDDNEKPLFIAKMINLDIIYLDDNEKPLFIAKEW